MIEITIKIPQWKDFTKWFWDKFCFPRRKVVAEYFELYNSYLIEGLVKHFFEVWNCNNNEEALLRLNEVEIYLKELMGKETKAIKEVMYKCK